MTLKKLQWYIETYEGVTLKGDELLNRWVAYHLQLWKIGDINHV